MTAPIPADIIAAAKASQAKWGIPASIAIAQWAVESGYGRHMPGGLSSNNPFGIKAVRGKPSVKASTREVIDGRDVYQNLGFRVFASVSEAFDEHGKLLATGKWYKNARSKLPNADAFADALTGVYATDPHYGQVLRSTMRSQNLYQYNDVAPSPATPQPVPADAYRALRRGNTGDDVKMWQTCLGVVTPREPGYGTFGPKTEEATRAFQRRHGLKDDGVVGEDTRAAAGADWWTRA